VHVYVHTCAHKAYICLPRLQTRCSDDLKMPLLQAPILENTIWLSVIGLILIHHKETPDQRCVNTFFVILPLVLVPGKGRNKSFLNMSLLWGLKPWSSLIFIPLSLQQHSQLSCLFWTNTYNILWFGPVLLGSNNLLTFLSKLLSWRTSLHPVTAYLKIKVTIGLHS